MPVYYMVVFICQLVLFLGIYFSKKENLKTYIHYVCLFLIIGYIYTSLGKNFFGMSLYFLCYSLIYLLGYLSKDYIIKFRNFIIYLSFCFLGILILMPVLNLRGVLTK